MGYAVYRLFNFLAASSRILYAALLHVKLIIRLSRSRLYRNLRPLFVSVKAGSRKSPAEHSIATYLDNLVEPKLLYLNAISIKQIKS